MIDFAYVLFFIYDIAKCTIKRLNSFQNTIFVKYITRYYDSFSNRVLKEKTNEFDFYNKFEFFFF